MPNPKETTTMTQTIFPRDGFHNIVTAPVRELTWIQSLEATDDSGTKFLVVPARIAYRRQVRKGWKLVVNGKETRPAFRTAEDARGYAEGSVARPWGKWAASVPTCATTSVVPGGQS